MDEEWEGFISKGDFFNPAPYRSIYSSKLFDELSSELGISSPEQRVAFETAALGSAGVYEHAKFSQLNKVQTNAETAALKSVAKAAGKLNSKLSDALNLSFLCSVRLSQGVGKSKDHALSTATPEFRQFLEAISKYEDGQGYLRMDLVFEFLNFFANSAQAAADNKNVKNSATKNTPVETWLFAIQQSWGEFSDQSFSPGRFDGGYGNRPLYVLRKLMQPLDKGVTPQSIESSLRSVCSKR